MKSPVRWLVLTLAASALVMPIRAQDPGPTQAKDLASLDLESLLDLKVTTATKFAEKLSDAPSVMYVVTRDELDRFGGTTLGEILARVPGLTGTSAYFTDRDLIAAQGDQTKIDGGHILFLINGRPTREILEGGLIGDLLESFPVNILERIEIVLGPGSVLYGSDAFSAVINLITQKADHDGFVVRGLGGAPGGEGASAEAMFQSGDLNIVAAGQFHQEPSWATTYWHPSYTTGLPVPDTLSILEGGQGGYLGLNYKNLSLMCSFTGYEDSVFAEISGQGRWKRGFADLGYSLKPSDRWEMTFNATYTRYTLDAANFAGANITRDSYELLFEWTNLIRPTDRDQLTIGTLFSHIQGTEYYYGVTPATVITNGARPSGAFYAQLDHQLLDTVKLIGGFQLNKIANIDLDFVPRAGVIWNPYSRLSVKALHGQAFRAPSLDETLLNDIWLKGNPNLRPEKVANIDLAVIYQGKRLEVGVSFFHSHQTDSIVELYNSEGIGRFVNLGEVIFHGGEMEEKYHFAKNFLLLGSVSYQHNVDGQGNQNITPIPDLGVKAGLSYEAPKRWTFSLFDIYEGPLDARFTGVLNPPPGPYHLLEANARFNLKYMGAGGRPGLAFVAHGENLATKQIWLPEWGDNPGDTMPVNRGRTVYIGIEMSWRKD
jgi:outer membrane receptor for ferrienterochelin and colicins